jgi:hypothetical protein
MVMPVRDGCAGVLQHRMPGAEFIRMSSLRCEQNEVSYSGKLPFCKSRCVTVNGRRPFLNVHCRMESTKPYSMSD